MFVSPCQKKNSSSTVIQNSLALGRFEEFGSEGTSQSIFSSAESICLVGRVKHHLLVQHYLFIISFFSAIDLELNATSLFQIVGCRGSTYTANLEQTQRQGREKGISVYFTSAQHLTELLANPGKPCRKHASSSLLPLHLQTRIYSFSYFSTNDRRHFSCKLQNQHSQSLLHSRANSYYSRSQRPLWLSLGTQLGGSLSPEV